METVSLQIQAEEKGACNTVKGGAVGGERSGSVSWGVLAERLESSLQGLQCVSS